MTVTGMLVRNRIKKLMHKTFNLERQVVSTAQKPGIEYFTRNMPRKAKHVENKVPIQQTGTESKI